MSIESLSQDLKDVQDSAKSLTGPLVSAADVASFMRNNLLPLIANVVSEVTEIDESVEAVVLRQEEVLHAESASVFAGIIASGRVLMSELMARSNGDPKIAAMVKEWADLSEQGEEILADITLPDPPEDDEDEEDEPEAAAPAKEPS